jgi:hypothetical protein
VANGFTPQPQPARPRVTTPGEARAMVNDVMEQLSALAHLVGEETALMQAGRMTDALAREARKSELAGRYMASLEHVKANAVALARFSPDDVQRLKGAHAEFLDMISTNQAVLTTARSISESIMRELATASSPQMRAAGYAPGPGSARPAPRPSAGPLMVSRSL